MSAAITYLTDAGLGRHAESIATWLDADTVDDLQLMTPALADDAIAALSLRGVTALKLKAVVAALAATPTPSSVAAPIAPRDSSLDACASKTAGDDDDDAERSALLLPPLADERTVVCIDRSGSMGAPFAELDINPTAKSVGTRSRMDAVKAMFYAFRDRVDGLGEHQKHELGLLSFDNRIEPLLALTSTLSLFESVIDDIEKRGSTEIYEAIIGAATMLQAAADADPPRPTVAVADATALSADPKEAGAAGAATSVDAAPPVASYARILVLTDGVSSNHGASATTALAAARSVGAVVDAIIVGSRPDEKLRKIVTATGGNCYVIANLGEGFELLEAEAVVSLRARNGGADRAPRDLAAEAAMDAKFISGTLAARAMTAAAAATTSGVVIAPRAPVRVTSAASALSRSSKVGRTSSKRVRKELQSVVDGVASVWLASGPGTGDGIHLFPSVAADGTTPNFSRIRAIIEGPPGSVFEGGTFVLEVSVPANYPFAAPSVRFITPIYHCNVSSTGRLCLDELHGNWSPSLSIPKILETIRNLLITPNVANALVSWIADLTIAHTKTAGVDTRYADAATAHTATHAGEGVNTIVTRWSAAAPAAP